MLFVLTQIDFSKISSPKKSHKDNVLSIYDPVSASGPDVHGGLRPDADLLEHRLLPL